MVNVTASLVALYSVMRVIGALGDYHIFFMSILGVVDVVVIAATLISTVEEGLLSGGHGLLPPLVLGAFLVWTGIRGAGPLWTAPSEGLVTGPRSGIGRMVDDVAQTAPFLSSHRTEIGRAHV